MERVGQAAMVEAARAGLQGWDAGPERVSGAGQGASHEGGERAGGEGAGGEAGSEGWGEGRGEGRGEGWGEGRGEGWGEGGTSQFPAGTRWGAAEKEAE